MTVFAFVVVEPGGKLEKIKFSVAMGRPEIAQIRIVPSVVLPCCVCCAVCVCCVCVLVCACVCLFDRLCECVLVL